MESIWLEERNNKFEMHKVIAAVNLKFFKRISKFLCCKLSRFDVEVIVYQGCHGLSEI